MFVFELPAKIPLGAMTADFEGFFHEATSPLEVRRLKGKLLIAGIL